MYTYIVLFIAFTLMYLHSFHILYMLNISKYILIFINVIFILHNEVI